MEVGVLLAGNYKYIASANLKGKNTTRSGEFSVNEVKLEQNNSVANHPLLFNMSDVTGGKMVSLEEVNSLGDFILENGDDSNVIFQEKDIDDPYPYDLDCSLTCIQDYVPTLQQQPASRRRQRRH